MKTLQPFESMINHTQKMMVSTNKGERGTETIIWVKLAKDPFCAVPL